MPRNVRNFWIDLSVEGRNSDIGAGPRSASGGFSERIYLRKDGYVGPCVSISGSTTPDDGLWLEVYYPTHEGIAVEDTGHGFILRWKR